MTVSPDWVGHASVLAPLVPDASRSSHTRHACRARLLRQARRRERADVARARAVRLIAPVLVGAYGLLYAVVLLMTTLRLHHLLP